MSCKLNCPIDPYYGEVRHRSGCITRLPITLISFGTKWGAPPPNLDRIVSVKAWWNPYSSEYKGARRSGLDPTLQGAILARTTGSGAMLDLLTAEIKDGERIGICCIGGIHRSVAATELLADRLRQAGRVVNVTHRDLWRRYSERGDSGPVCCNAGCPSKRKKSRKAPSRERLAQ